jgi:hypothetical protein
VWESPATETWSRSVMFLTQPCRLGQSSCPATSIHGASPKLHCCSPVQSFPGPGEVKDIFRHLNPECRDCQGGSSLCLYDAAILPHSEVTGSGGRSIPLQPLANTPSPSRRSVGAFRLHGQRKPSNRFPRVHPLGGENGRWVARPPPRLNHTPQRAVSAALRVRGGAHRRGSHPSRRCRVAPHHPAPGRRRRS